MKLEMAVLYDGPGGWWDLITINVPDIYNNRPYHLLDQIGRRKLLEMEKRGELGDFSGSYLYNYDETFDAGDLLDFTLYEMKHDEMEVPRTKSSDLATKTRMAGLQRNLSGMYGDSPKRFDRLDLD